MSNYLAIIGLLFGSSIIMNKHGSLYMVVQFFSSFSNKMKYVAFPSSRKAYLIRNGKN